MSSPRTVVLPFGVPAEGQGLGLGLAALLHVCVQVDGGGVAIAQLHARRKDQPPGAKPSPVEAFIPPAEWRQLAERGEALDVAIVVTGAFEPPLDGQGALQLLAFDARDGRTRARVDAPLDELHAGASLVGAIEQLGADLGAGKVGPLDMLRDLAWEPLESVLRAERCALHDPLLGRPHDPLAAMLHLGRAIGDAPDARYPIERLASIALETAQGPALEPKLAAAAARALTRAVGDAPGHVELTEALAALELRQGQATQAQRRIEDALPTAPKRVRLHALLAQALRAQGHLDAALAALQVGQEQTGGDPVLTSERGLVLAARGDFAGASHAWREALARDAVQPIAFGSLATLVLRAGDTTTAGALVDAALASPRAHPEVLRRAVQLALTEGEGLARSSRVARLSTRLLEVVPDEPWATLALAKSELALGERASARARLLHVERIAARTAVAAEAQATRLAIDDPGAELEVRAVMRAAQSAAPHELLDVAARARRLATAHASWPAWVGSALAQRRLERWMAAREALEAAIELAPGASVAHVDLAESLLALEDAPAAIASALQAIALEGETPRTLSVLARSLAGAGRPTEARDTARRALLLQPNNATMRALFERPVGKAASWTDRVKGAWRGWRGS